MSLRRALLAAALSWLPVAPAQARDVLDATRARVRLAETPLRVVTLAPSLGELAADLLGESMDRIVGVSEYTDYPPPLKSRPSIGPYSRFNLERVLALKPDLVLATTDGNPQDQVLHLRELGIPVVVVNTGSFGEIENSMRLAAQALGIPAEGDRMARQLERGLSNVRARARRRSGRKVMLQVGGDPLVVAGGKSFLNDALEQVGATNAFRDSGSGYPHPSMEDVIRRDPEVILVMALTEDRSAFNRMAAAWAEFPKIRAVRSRAVHVLRADALLRPTLRILEGLGQLERALDEAN